MVDTTAILSGLSFAGVTIGLLWKWRFAIIPLAEFLVTFLRTPFRQQREAVSAISAEPIPDSQIEIVIGDFRLTRQPSVPIIRRLSVDDNVTLLKVPSEQPEHSSEHSKTLVPSGMPSSSEPKVPSELAPITQATIQHIVKEWQGKKITMNSTFSMISQSKPKAEELLTQVLKLKVVEPSIVEQICTDTITQVLKQHRQLLDKYISDDAVDLIIECIPFLVKQVFDAAEVIEEKVKATCFSCVGSDSTLPPTANKTTCPWVSSHPILCPDSSCPGPVGPVGPVGNTSRAVDVVQAVDTPIVVDRVKPINSSGWIPNKSLSANAKKVINHVMDKDYKAASKVTLNAEDHDYLTRLFHKASIDVELSGNKDTRSDTDDREDQRSAENSAQNPYERLYTRFQVLLGQSRINDNPTIKTKLEQVIQEMVNLEVIDQETADLTIQQYCQ
ncbi:hypothetical protein HDU85_007242 [Gaertneriomyces sp. JEL0708]|nr:hypothetical protein HDU85_007242 [Gaertneriomyces sp. JEL0708]